MIYDVVKTLSEIYIIGRTRAQLLLSINHGKPPPAALPPSGRRADAAAARLPPTHRPTHLRSTEPPPPATPAANASPRRLRVGALVIDAGWFAKLVANGFKLVGAARRGAAARSLRRAGRGLARGGNDAPSQRVCPLGRLAGAPVGGGWPLVCRISLCVFAFPAYLHPGDLAATLEDSPDGIGVVVGQTADDEVAANGGGVTASLRS